MKIKIDDIKRGKDLLGYRADFTELPGSPPIGTGKTIAEAVSTLFIRNLDRVKNLDIEYLEINDKPYEDYVSYDR